MLPLSLLETGTQGPESRRIDKKRRPAQIPPSLKDAKNAVLERSWSGPGMVTTLHSGPDLVTPVPNVLFLPADETTAGCFSATGPYGALPRGVLKRYNLPFEATI